MSPLVPLIKDLEWLKSEVENLKETVGRLSAPKGIRCKIVVTADGEDMNTLSDIPFDVVVARQLFEVELTRVKALFATAQSRLWAAETAAQCEVTA